MNLTQTLKQLATGSPAPELAEPEAERRWRRGGGVHLPRARNSSQRQPDAGAVAAGRQRSRIYSDGRARAGSCGFTGVEGAPRVRGFAQSLARLLQPFEGEALHVVAADPDTEVSRLRDFLLFGCGRALLLEGTEAKQIACCVYGACYADDMHQAKAIAAVETGFPAVAAPVERP